MGGWVEPTYGSPGEGAREEWLAGMGRAAPSAVSEGLGLTLHGGVGALVEGEEGERGVRRWHVLHTKSRQEKAVSEVLEASGVEHFLPLVRLVRFYAHRRRVVESPLFSSYVFVKGAMEQVYVALNTSRVARVIAVADQERFEHELMQIRGVVADGGVLTPCGYLAVGRRVRVRSGPFKGAEGLVEDHLRQDRLVLQIQTLGQAASMEIDASLLEPVN